LQALEREINDLNTQIEKTQRALDFDQEELADVEKEMDGAGEVIADLETQKAEAVRKHSNAVANGAAIVKQLFLEEQVTRAVKDLANQQELLARTQDEERVPLQKKIEGLQVSERLSLRSFPFHFSCRALQSYSPRLILFFLVLWHVFLFFHHRPHSRISADDTTRPNIVCSTCRTRWEWTLRCVQARTRALASRAPAAAWQLQALPWSVQFVDGSWFCCFDFVDSPRPLLRPRKISR
jgi:hypothetical protein